MREILDGLHEKDAAVAADKDIDISSGKYDDSLDSRHEVVDY